MLQFFRDRWRLGRITLASFRYGWTRGQLDVAIQHGEDRFKDWDRVAARRTSLQRLAEEAGFQPDQFMQTIDARMRP